METILITGGTGMIGKALTKALLDKGYGIIILTRRIPDSRFGMRDTGRIANRGSRIQYATWDINDQRIDEGAISKADHIIHLAGAGIAEKRWNKKRKKEIVSSRTDSGKLISDFLKRIPNHVYTIVSASGIGWYGPDPVIPNPQAFTEDDPPAEDFLGQTCKRWEESLEPVMASGKRLVKLRIGMVLGKKDGVLKEFLKPLSFGIATVLGSGNQVVSWIHIDDLVRICIEAIENPAIKGAYNAVAPGPVSNKEFVRQLARIKNGRSFISLKVPPFILKAVLGEMSLEVLKSTTVSSSKILRSGFEFKFPTIEAAFRDLFE